MIFGFNTDVRGKDAVYHVQTEDRGEKNPIIDSIIYVGGKIVDRVRTSYVPQETTQPEIEVLVRNQHRALVESIRSGAFPLSRQHPASLPPAPLPPPPGYAVRLLNEGNIEKDGQLFFEFSVWDKISMRPLQGASLDVRWIPAGGVVQKAALQTGEYGTASVSFPIPEDQPEIALLISAKGPDAHELVKFHIRRTEAQA